MKVIMDLSRFIKCNKSLVHLNLENTGLSVEMIKQLLTVIKKSRNIQAIHLCNNPGVYDGSLYAYVVDFMNPINMSEWTDIGGYKKQKSRDYRNSGM